ncbi:MAG: MucR family transcriptional regulator [Desulfovibrio sp.]
MDRTEAMKQALEIVKAQASVRTMNEDEITNMMGKLTASIMSIEGPTPIEEQPPLMDPAKAIKEASIVCLECGKSFKILTKKHLASHGLTPEQYREKYGYRKGQALACKSLVRERRKKMKDMALWERRKKPAAEAK